MNLLFDNANLTFYPSSANGVQFFENCLTAVVKESTDDVIVAIHLEDDEGMGLNEFCLTTSKERRSFLMNSDNLLRLHTSPTVIIDAQSGNNRVLFCFNNFRQVDLLISLDKETTEQVRVKQRSILEGVKHIVLTPNNNFVLAAGADRIWVNLGNVDPLHNELLKRIRAFSSTRSLGAANMCKRLYKERMLFNVTTDILSEKLFTQGDFVNTNAFLNSNYLDILDQSAIESGFLESKFKDKEHQQLIKNVEKFKSDFTQVIEKAITKLRELS